MDRMTEIIAHFGGLFHLNIEASRLRDQYEVFKGEEAKYNIKQPELTGVEVEVSYDLRGYDPSVDKTPPADAPLPEEAQAIELPLVPAVSFDGFTGPLGPQFADAYPGAGASGGGETVLPFVPIPSSIATVTVQSISLMDNDVIGDMDATSFVSPQDLIADLQATEALASTLGVPGPGGHDIMAHGVEEMASHAANVIDTFEAPTFPGLDSSVLNREAVESLAEAGRSVVVNGKGAAEAVALDELRPEFLSDEPDNGSDTENEEAPPDPFEGTGFEPGPTPAGTDGGHTIVTGGNEMINSASLTTSWIDAGVIVVGGNVTNAKVVSQLNVLGDRDNLPFDDSGAGSQSHNIADFSVQSDQIDDAAAEAASGKSLSLPKTWKLETFEGDVVSYNSISQYSFLSDADRIDFSISASETYLGTGENLLLNSANMFEIGFGYDLIFVGGNMTTVDMISQTNVLLDYDHVEMPTGHGVAVSASDNSLVNSASIEKHGVDTYQELGSTFSDELLRLTEGAQDIASETARDELFEGVDALRALYITGALTKITKIAQTNVLGDQDQVKLAMDSFLDAANGAAEMIAGSNQLTNMAKLVDLGLDSTIMAAGDVYDDLLLHQAELIDTDAHPLGVGLPALANEAVAFLADDMLLPDKPGGDNDGHGAVDQHEGAHSVDVMQTMTA